MLRPLPPALLVGLLLALPAGGEPPRPPEPPHFVDDEAVQQQFTARLAKLALGGRCLPADKLRQQVAADKTCRLTPAAPADRRLDPEDVYAAALKSVLVFGSVTDDNGEYVDGRMATAWVLTADGAVVTNWHVLDRAEDGERFGAMTHDGRAFPVTAVLAVDKAADIAVVKLDATGLVPLPLATQPPRVGAWVGVLGHPGDRYFTFTQGHVSRYTAQKPTDGPAERWMSVTAEYAYGSSGSPVLDRTGAVIGMAALTESLDYPMDDTPAPAAGQPKPPPAEADRGSRLQMVVKLVTPLGELRRTVGGASGKPE
jgi:S1-C subfamily serine protease